jgi:Na+-translocating ferredoxin:NAD+ oxidoreductase RnfG subunit
MRRPFIILLICTASLTVIAQSEINYFPPALVKALTGNSRQPQPKLQEIKLPGDFESQVFPGKFYHLENSEVSNVIRYVYIGRVNSCRSGVCFGDQGTGPEQTSEYFDYFVLYNTEGVVQLVKVYNYQATHGQEITAASWLKQFIGYRSKTKLNTGKDIDAISGATISVEGIVADIQQKTEILGSFLELQSNR